MENHTFFKPTALYKEFIILEEITKDPLITQRELAKKIQGSVSMVNQYLETYEKNNYLTKNYTSQKNVQYLITDKGIERRKLLNIRYLKSAQIMYNQAKKEITYFLSNIVNKGFNKIILYGAGDVASIILETLKIDQDIKLDVVAIIDDHRKEEYIYDKKVITIDEINDYGHDGVFVSSYTHSDAIVKKLIEKKYDQNKIIKFFD